VSGVFLVWLFMVVVLRSGQSRYLEFYVEISFIRAGVKQAGSSFWGPYPGRAGDGNLGSRPQRRTVCGSLFFRAPRRLSTARNVMTVGAVREQGKHPELRSGAWRACAAHPRSDK